MRKKVPKGWVKISEFATLTGLSVKTITAAMKRGTIPADEVARVGSSATSPYYLNPSTVATSWAENLNATHPNTPAVRTALEAYLASLAPKPKGKPAAKPKASGKASAVSIPVPDAETEKMTLAEAQRLEREAKAKIALLELQEKEGTLVLRSEINRQLAAGGKELRDALLTIPARYIDLIRAEDNRTIAMNILYDALASTLQKLTDIQQGINK